MIRRFFFLFGALFLSLAGHAQSANIKGPFVWHSKVFSGTERNYWIYVPKQYDSLKPACLMVVQDGLGRANDWNLPAVLDSLISLKEIPVVIGIFIDPGKVPSTTSDAYPLYNRSFEYDGLGDLYARFLIEEILPEVGRSYNLSKDPNDRSIAGASSGAICAFNVAWERPDAFRRVLSTIGTYVGLRGGDELATLVRKTEPKPLRIFLEDGDHDLNIYAGDWWMSNQNMLSALTWAGYEVNHSWGTGGHEGKHARAILPDAMKWLWKDHPQPIKVSNSINHHPNILLENESWKEVKLKNVAVSRLAVNKSGEVFFTHGRLVYKVDNNAALSEYAKISGNAGGLTFGPGGKLYVNDETQAKIVSIDEKGVVADVIKNVAGAAAYLVSTPKGLYFSQRSRQHIGFYSFELKSLIPPKVVSQDPTGLAISAEQTFLHVGFDAGVFGLSSVLMEDGNFDWPKTYTHYHVGYGRPFPDTGGMTVDSENILYACTSLGIQTVDQLGRVNFIISNPTRGECVDVKFGGRDFNILYAACGGKLYSRKINARGILSWLPPVKPPKPKM